MISETPRKRLAGVVFGIPEVAYRVQRYGFPDALIMFLQRPALRFVHVAFLFRRAGGRAGDGAPVIQHPWHMTDLAGLCPFRNPQREVPVLRAFEPFPKSSELASKAGMVDAKVADAILRAQQIRVPVRLQIRSRAKPDFIDLVFVRIDDRRIRIFPDLPGDPVQRIGRQFVVVIQQRAKASRCHGKRRIGGLRNMAVTLAHEDLDARIGPRIRLDDLPHMRLRRRIVGDAELPVGIDLVQHRADALVEPAGRRVVGRQQDR